MTNPKVNQAEGVLSTLSSYADEDISAALKEVKIAATPIGERKQPKDKVNIATSESSSVHEAVVGELVSVDEKLELINSRLTQLADSMNESARSIDQEALIKIVSAGVIDKVHTLLLEERREVEGQVKIISEAFNREIVLLRNQIDTLSKPKKKAANNSSPEDNENWDALEQPDDLYDDLETTPVYPDTYTYSAQLSKEMHEVPMLNPENSERIRTSRPSVRTSVRSTKGVVTKDGSSVQKKVYDMMNDL